MCACMYFVSTHEVSTYIHPFFQHLPFLGADTVMVQARATTYIVPVSEVYPLGPLARVCTYDTYLGSCSFRAANYCRLFRSIKPYPSSAHAPSWCRNMWRASRHQAGSAPPAPATPRVRSFRRASTRFSLKTQASLLRPLEKRHPGCRAVMPARNGSPATADARQLP